MTDNPVPATTDAMVYFGVGWPFPDYPESNGRSVGYEWNGSTTQNLTLQSAASNGVANGAWSASANSADPQMVSPSFGITSLHAPILSLSIQYDHIDPASTTAERCLHDFWATEAEPLFPEDKSVFTYDYPMIPVPHVSTAADRRLYFPMYLHPKWMGQRITRLRIDPFHPTPGVARNFSWSIDYCRRSYDTRHVFNNPIFVLASAQNVFWDGNTTELRANLGRMRAATRFMLTHTRGDELNLLQQDFSVGHDGLRFTAPSTNARRYGQGIGPNYCGLRDLIIGNPGGGTLRLRFRTDPSDVATILRNGTPVSDTVTRSDGYVEIDVVPQAAEWTLSVPSPGETFAIY